MLLTYAYAKTNSAQVGVMVTLNNATYINSKAGSQFPVTQLAHVFIEFPIEYSLQLISHTGPTPTV